MAIVGVQRIVHPRPHLTAKERKFETLAYIRTLRKVHTKKALLESRKEEILS
jgi:hypothetical protein